MRLRTIICHILLSVSSLNSLAKGGVWLVLEKERERRGVYGHIVLSREVLLPGGKKTLREEKPADPEHLECATGKEACESAGL